MASLVLLFATSALADITDVADATAQNGTDATSLTPSEPAGTQEDDIVTAFCHIYSADGAWTDPADFTEIDQVTEATGAYDTYLGYKVRGADAGSGYNFTYSGSADGGRCTLQTFRGEDTSTPLDVSYVRASHYNFNQNECLSTPQSITTSTDGAAVVVFHHPGFDGSYTAAAPANYTLVADNQVSLRAQNVAFRLIASAGGESPGAWQHTGCDASGESANYTIAIKPAVTSVAPLRRHWRPKL